MKLTMPLIALFAATCIAVAGCTGSGTGQPNVPPVFNPATQMLPTGGLGSDETANAKSCRAAHGCPAGLVLPLIFNGKTFSVGHFASCKSVSLGNATAYSVARTTRLALRGNVTLKPTCVPSSTSAQLFIAVAEIGKQSKHGAGTIDVTTGPAHLSFVPLGHLANIATTWTFTPLGLGTALTPHTKYVFYVISVPLGATNAGGNYLLLQPLSFNGSTFGVVPNACYQGDPQDAPPYVASTSGPLTLSGTVAIAPTCVPSPLPSSPPQLYIVALDLSTAGDLKHASAAMRAQRSTRPLDYSFGTQAVAIAGPVNLTDNPWNFAPESPGLTMTAGTSYAFFIAAALPPPPPPTQSFAEVVPLNFDGTAFTVPSIAACSSLPSPVPYTAATNGSLALSGPVSIAATCPPLPGSSSSSASASPAPLYIVAAVACVPNGGSSSSGCSGSGSSSASRIRPNDNSGNCTTGTIGGGDNAKRPSDGSASAACTIYGYAIAGPVDSSSNPWVFDPLAPPLTLSAGMQYTFYIGAEIGGGSDGGDN